MKNLLQFSLIVVGMTWLTMGSTQAQGLFIHTKVDINEDIGEVQIYWEAGNQENVVEWIVRRLSFNGTNGSTNIATIPGNRQPEGQYWVTDRVDVPGRYVYIIIARMEDGTQRTMRTFYVSLGFSQPDDRLPNHFRPFFTPALP